MNRLNELAEIGRTARFAGRPDEAAIYFEEAFRLAKQLQLYEMAIEYGADAVDNLTYFGNNVKALTFILEIFQIDKVHFKKELYLFLKYRYFSIARRTNPEYDNLLRLLEELELYSKENNNLLEYTVLMWRADLLITFGKFEKALTMIERSWACYKPDPEGLAMYILCQEGCIVSLELGDIKAADRWLSLYHHDNSGLHAKKVEELHDKILLLLYKKKKAQEVFTLISQLDDAISGFSEVGILLEAKEVIVRVNLLKDWLGDPAHSLHPAKAILMDRNLIKLRNFSVIQKNLWSVLLIDYRLACLRFIVDIKPVDDYWYQFKQKVKLKKNISNVDEVKLRISKVQISINYASILASDLDRRLKCSIYMQKIRNRQDRLNEILENLPGKL